MTPPLRIGLLGGSFNPAHEGHFHLAQHALKRLNLHQIWWLVSPQNPLKSSDNMADYALRLASVEQLIGAHPHHRICEIEQHYQLNYTVDTLQRLRNLQPHHYVWLMGMDNLTHFHRWKGWKEIMHLMPVAVFDRAPHVHEALRSPMSILYRHQRVVSRNAATLPGSNTPAWSTIFMPHHSQSSTRLRKIFGESAFLR